MLLRDFFNRGLALFLRALILSEPAMVSIPWILLPTAVPGVGLTMPEGEGHELSLLARNRPVEREISTGMSHYYRISLDYGQYVRVVVEQEGIDLGVVLYKPGGQKITELGCRQNEPTPISLIAEVGGTYRLELRSRDSDLAHGRYKVRIEELRVPTGNDSSRIAAERAFAEGEQLRAELRTEFRRKAIRRYEEALVQWRTAGERQEEANTIKHIGEVFHSLGEPLKALKYYNQALRISHEVHDRRGEGETVNSIGYVHLQLGENQKALEYCTEALAISRAVGNFRGEAQALSSIGEVHYYLGNIEKALEFYQQTLPLWQALNDRRGQAQALLDVGYVYSDLSETHKALDSYNQALALWRAINDRRGQAITLTAIAFRCSMSGEKQKALDLHNQASQLFQNLGDKVGEAKLFNGMATIYDEMGEKERALENYKKALELYRAVGLRKGEAGQLWRMGEVYSSLGDNQKALNYYYQALSVVQAVADRKMESYVRRGIGMAYDSSGDKTKALDYYYQTLSLNQSVKDRRGEAYTRNLIGHIYDEKGDKRTALDYYTQALPLSQAAEDRIVESLTLYNIARVERDRGNLSEARSQLELTLRIVESLRTKVASQELRASYFGSARQYYDLYIDLLMQMHKQHPSEGFEAAALQASERARARSLLENLSESRAEIRQGIDPGLLERERSLQQLLNTKAERQMRLLSGKVNEAESRALAKEIRDLTAEYEELQGQIRSKSPRYAALTQPQLLSLQEIQQRVLDDQTLLLEYALGNERSYLWAVTQTAMIGYELPARAEIEKAASHVHKLLIARQPKAGESARQLQARVTEADAQYWQQAAPLSQMLLGPVASQLGTKRLLIVAEGALQYVPFGALPKPTPEGETAIAKRESHPVPKTEDGGTKGQEPGSANRDTFMPLMVDHEIVNLPSASVMAVLRRETRKRNAAAKAVAVLADPVFEADDPRLTEIRVTRQPVDSESLSSAVSHVVSPPHRSPAQATSRVSPPPRRRIAQSPRVLTELQRALRGVGLSRDGLSVPRLLSTRDEAESILSVTPEGQGMKAVGFDANLARAVSPELGQYRIIHFATHGLLNNEHPGLSGLVLSLVDERGRSQDGFLRLHDIYNLNLPADLVVLSACNTGLGKDVKGEGLVGIVRGFMYAGAARVVASLWKVDDVATAELMKRFYRHMLQANLPPAAALRAAQIEMWKQKQWQSPYYWAAFVLQGEWKSDTAPSAPSQE